MAFKVKVTFPGNPDFGQYAPISRPVTLTAPTLRELGQKVREARELADAGGGNCEQNPVINLDTGKAVGEFSYNGRLWTLGPWGTQKELDLDTGKEAAHA